jgi:uncharacterized protein (DUF924 family)
MESPDSIHKFWFGPSIDETAIIAAQSKLWWDKNAKIDERMRTRFEATVSEAAHGRLADWRLQPLGLLALILLTDQFPRNIYRGSARAFACDAEARRLCKDAIAARYDRGLRIIERVFIYLPLEHSEDPADQEESVRRYTALLSEAPAPLKTSFQGFLDYARRHRDVIDRFGRFPHRNAILGITSTPEELTFLEQPGSSF